MRRVDEVLTEVGKCKSDGDQNHNGLRETGGPKRAGAALIGQSKIADDTHTDNQDKTGSRGAEAEIDGSVRQGTPWRPVQCMSSRGLARR